MLAAMGARQLPFLTPLPRALIAWALGVTAACEEAGPVTAPDAAKAADASGDGAGDLAVALDGESLIPDGGSVTVEVDGTIGPWAQACLQAPQMCDDGNPCTVDGCDPISGCTALVKSCADDDPCTLDKCSVQTGTCVHAADTCDDGNACTEGVCTAGVGCTFTAANCADDQPCTSDGCSPQTGCAHAPLDCNDGKTCTVDSCNPQKGCQNLAPPGAKCCEIAVDCDDGDVCTAHKCLFGVCSTQPIANCCKSAADCDDGNTCTADLCATATGQCSHQPKQEKGCCAKDLDCDDATQCTLDKCVDAKCGHEPTCCTTSAGCGDIVQGVAECADATCTTAGCAALPKLDPLTKVVPAPCCVPQVAKAGFEPGEAWSPVLVPSQYGQWAVLAGVGQSSSSAAVFKPVDGGVVGGGSVAQVRMPAINLPIGVDTKLKFSFKGQYGQGDMFRLRATTSVGSWWIWQGNPNTNIWQTPTVDLNALAARAATRNVQLTWELLQAKGSPVGLHLDDIALTSTCKPKACAIDVQCNDNLGLSKESCLAGVCTYAAGVDYCENDSTVCDDKNPCTSDYCSNFTCYHAKINNCCTNVGECDDGKKCTLETCIGQQCQFNKLPPAQCCDTAVDCDDKKICTLDMCPVAGLPCQHTKTAPDCCDAVGDCDDGDKCTLESCTKNVCSTKNICCKAAKDCDDGDPMCTDDQCIDGLCSWTKLSKPGCCEPVMQQSDFESGKPDWLVPQGTSATAKWQWLTGKQAKSGKGALYYGDPTKGNFDTGATHSGTIQQAVALTLPLGATVKFSFQLWMDTEGGSYDEFKVNVIGASGPKAVFVKSTYPKWQLKQWMPIEVDLSAYAGQAVVLQLLFDTIDQIGNGGEGVYVDDWKLERNCP